MKRYLPALLLIAVTACTAAVQAIGAGCDTYGQWRAHAPFESFAELPSGWRTAIKALDDAMTKACT